ncbi:hypothetical protein AADG42_05635 [Ammonicoccus fulvus]|uniref:Uncharacterized protein n=1 Tax=Ammonicoccus fulvus TaxID=3138240 RepID=A0ABZ3FPS1_9ACTN
MSGIEERPFSPDPDYAERMTELTHKHRDLIAAALMAYAPDAGPDEPACRALADAVRTRRFILLGAEDRGPCDHDEPGDPDL